MIDESSTARDFMSKQLVLLEPDQDVLRAMEILVEHNISGAPVVDPRGSLVGILTERDCLRVAFDASYHQQPAGTVSEYMSSPVETLSARSTVVEVVERFLRSRFRRFPVMDGNLLVGQISRRDILRAIAELW